MYEGVPYDYLAYSYSCEGESFTLSKITLSTSNIIYATVGIDIFIIACFLLFLISENRAEQTEIDNFKMRELAVHDFTVKISGFHLNRYERDLA